MEKRAKRILQVLKEPENCIVIVGILVSAVLAYFGIQDNDIQQVLAAILAILSSLAVAQIIVAYATIDRDEKIDEILDRLPKSDKLSIFSDQDEASPKLIELIKEDKPKKADLIELSTFTIPGLLNRLRQENCYIRLLIQNPNFAVTEWQKERIQQCIRNLANVTLSGYTRCEVKLYAVPGSIRGRLINESLINVGWYTYSSDNVGVYGHDNPLVTTNVDTPEGRKLCWMFQRAFKWLWDHPKTITLDMAIKQMTEQKE